MIGWEPLRTLISKQFKEILSEHVRVKGHPWKASPWKEKKKKSVEGMQYTGQELKNCCSHYHWLGLFVASKLFGGGGGGVGGRIVCLF